MSWLSEEEYYEILKTVSIYPVSSAEVGDISQFAFDCGEATEYRDFLYEDARPSDKTVSMRRNIF